MDQQDNEVPSELEAMRRKIEEVYAADREANTAKGADDDLSASRPRMRLVNSKFDMNAHLEKCRADWQNKLLTAAARMRALLVAVDLSSTLGLELRADIKEVLRQTEPTLHPNETTKAPHDLPH